MTDPVPGFATPTLFPTTEIRLIYGTGKSRSFLWRPGTAKGSFPIRLPLAFVWVGGNGYLITTQSDVIDNQAFDVVSVVPPEPAKRVFPGSGFKYVIPR